MFGRSITTITACALGASALLLPPGVAFDKDAPFSLTANPEHRTVTFPCPSCAFSSKQEKSAQADDFTDDLFWSQGGAKSIAVNFTVSKDGRSLEMGGSRIYPGAVTAPTVHQLSTGTSMTDLESGDAPTVALEVTSLKVNVLTLFVNVVAPKDGSSLLLLTVSGMSLEDQALTLPLLELTMLELADGQILIVNAESTHDRHINNPHHNSQHTGGLSVRPDRRPMTRPDAFGRHGKPVHKECGMLPAPLCRMKHAIEAKIHGLRKGNRPACHGGKGKHSNPWMGKDGHVRLPSHIKGPKFHMAFNPLDSSFQGHHRPDGHHQHHQHAHGFFHAFVKGFIAVLIPVMAGVAVGMAVSFVGLALGRLITFVWVNVVRGGKRGYASVALSEDVVESGDAKGGDFTDMDAPPTYESAPKYEDVAQVDVKEEK
nr:hypothetical protein CFP56_31603 [Quercus suber]